MVGGVTPRALARCSSNRRSVGSANDTGLFDSIPAEHKSLGNRLQPTSDNLAFAELSP